MDDRSYWTDGKEPRNDLDEILLCIAEMAFTQEDAVRLAVGDDSPRSETGVLRWERMARPLRLQTTTGDRSMANGWTGCVDRQSYPLEQYSVVKRFHLHTQNLEFGLRWLPKNLVPSFHLLLYLPLIVLVHAIPSAS